MSADVAPPAEPAATDEAEAPAGPSLRERLTPFRLLVAATAVLAVIAILLGLMVFAPSVAPIKLGSARLAAGAGDVKEIETVSRRFAENFLTIDYRTLDADFERVRADTTGKFRNELDGSLELVGDLLRKAQSVSKGDVSEVTVLSRDAETAFVSAKVNRTFTNERIANPRPRQHTLRITLVRTASGWKVDDLTEDPGAIGTGGVVPSRPK